MALTIIINAVLMLLILACGRVLHTTGRPYLRGLYITHIAATIAFVAYVLYHFIASGHAVSGMTAMLITGLISLVVLIFTGLFLSLERYLIPSLWLHRLSTLGFIISLIVIIRQILSA